MILVTALIFGTFLMTESSVAQTEEQSIAGAPAKPGAPVKPFVASPPPPGKAKSPKTLEPYPEGGPQPVGPIPAPTPVEDGIIQTDGDKESKLVAPQSGEISAPDVLSAPDVNAAGVTAPAFPPDTVLDAGPNHIIQMTNNTGYIVFDKQGNPIGGATPNAAIRLMSGLWPAGDVCAQDDTDPIVVYDHLADRWLMAQVIRDPAAPGGGAFNPPGPALCIAVSTTPDPTSTWYAYTYDTTDLNGIFPDYEKFGVWPDGYYMSSYEGSNLGVFVFDRTNMLAGAAAGFIKTTISSLTPSAGVRNTRILPADLDGSTPAVGTPNFWVRPVDDQQDTGNPTDRIEVYEAVTDWSVPSLAFNLVDTLTPAPFQVMLCNRNGDGFRACVPEPNAGTVDALSNRPMAQLKFRNFGGDFRMVFNQTINVQGGLASTLGIPIANEVAGIRWYELRKNGPNWTIEQEGTYSPQPIGVSTEAQLLHRWMGSIAMDKFGSIALGYNIVNSDVTNPIHPGISYSGRRFNDIQGFLTQTEQSILAGVNSQAGTGNRWGDYSAMTVDPVDDCTFWYTQHVADQTGGGGKPTQIASFRFDYCGTDLAITKTANPSPATAGGQLIYTVTVTNNGPLDATNVTVVDTLPAGVTYQADTDSCSAAGQVLTCNLGAIANGGSVAFDIKALINSSLTTTTGTTTITNTAVVSSDQADLDKTNNTVFLTTIVEESADLQLTKQCKPDGATPTGSTATCTIFVDNLGLSDARNVVVTDAHLSNGSFTIVSATFDHPPEGACGIWNGMVTCNLNTEPAGGRTTITVQITSNDQVDVNDTATIKSDTFDPNTANNIATGKVSFTGTADLSLTKSDSPDPVIAGQNLTYTLTAANSGPSAAPNVVVKDILPAEMSLVSATPSQGSCSGTTVPGDPLQPLTCNLGALANTAAATITVVVKVDQDVPNGNILVNNANVSSDYADANNGDNNATATTTVNTAADLAIVKTADKAVYKPSSLVTYTVKVTNNGSSDARQVVVTDNLPNLRQAIYQSDTGGCVKNATTPTKLTCDMGYIPAGEFRSFQVYVLVRGSRGQVSNNVTVQSSDTDPAPGNNSSTRTVTIGK
jgi:uncharacterized repeat protein (TIGR01451 family)